jgi:glycosyltransferase involved in cell wall biosynthesis
VCSRVPDPRISIVIPSYGRKSFLAEALRSVEMQTYPAHEVIVVDDCSPDPVELPSGVDLNVNLLRLPVNGGPGAARNAGLQVASGDWLLFLDDDDMLTPDRLKMAVEDMSGARSHAAGVELFWPDGSAQRYAAKYFEGDLRRTFNRGPHPCMGQVVHHREDIVTFGDLRVSQDTEWWLRMEHAAFFSWSPEIGLRVRRHPEKRSGVAHDSRYYSRREIARIHRQSLDRRARARVYGDVGAAALRSQKRLAAFGWSARSLASFPTVLNAKRLARSMSWRMTDTEETS